MNRYTIAAGNPEGTDFSIDFLHKDKLTEEEFNKISEEAIVYALEEDYKKNNHAYISSLSCEYIIKYMEDKGFCAPERNIATYYLEPYWGMSSINSKKLLAWIDLKHVNGKECPEYMIT